MSASRAPYLSDWRFSMSLVPKNLTDDCQDPGKTFRGPHARVENGLNKICNDANTAFRRGATAKPGPTTDTTSRIARIKKLQTRTKTRPGFQSNGGTQRGAHATVENGSTGAAPGSHRAQLFGNYGPSNPANTAGQTSGRSGDSSQVIYFKNVFDRVSLNQPTAGDN